MSYPKYPKYSVNSLAMARRKLSKPRLCLRCGKTFASLGPEKRICVCCSGHAAWTVSAADAAYAAAVDAVDAAVDAAGGKAEWKAQVADIVEMLKLEEKP